MTEEKKGKIIYERLPNGVEIIDAQEYYKNGIECARNAYYAFLITAIFIGILFMVGYVIPWLLSFAHTMVCSVPNWPVAGGCP